MLRLALAFLLLVTPVSAEEVVLGLSQDEVAINATFDGDDILIFGAVKREKPIPNGDPLEVIVAVAGPLEPLTVRRKDKRLGIWINVDAVVIDEAPSFYAVASTGPIEEVLSNTEDLRHKITINRAIRFVGAPEQITDSGKFTEALIRIRKEAELYQTLENNVELAQQTLFRTQINMPANLVEGGYKTRIFLTRGGEVINTYERIIDVRKVGLERWLYNMAHDTPLLYGLMSLAIAIAAGWGASAVFRMIKG
ncbi:TIGR02186 family protein [Cognatishimia sp. MH4019]|uniref:TIGR02186 family protein n=1 Tax=Cognatishimia sp. MH4019 TaxID=2854030 RepID=UPI001CD2E3E6|nr:TIGR02186 family protein [Cognatishimia sp. MH4019]